MKLAHPSNGQHFNVKFDLGCALKEEVAPLSYIKSSDQLLRRRNTFPNAPVEQKNPMDV